MSLDESFVMSSALSKKKTTKKPAQDSPTSELLSNEEKRPTTKVMISNALTDLNTRKGVSLYAIKKYMEDNYQVNTEKSNNLIKKTIKAGVENGSIIQIKGIGASGSFKLAVVKPQKKKNEDKKEKSNAVEKPAKKKATEEKIKKPQKKEAEKATKTKVGQKMQKQTKSKAAPAEKRVIKTKMVKSKMTKVTSKDTGTPTKKLIATMKRKSVGSIIKPPKMKPRKV